MVSIRAARRHCDRRQLHYCKFISDERLSANVPSTPQRHLSGIICQHLFWTVTLTLFKATLKIKLICSLLFLANCLDLSASASEAMAPWRSIDHVLYCIIFLTMFGYYLTIKLFVHRSNSENIRKINSTSCLAEVIISDFLQNDIDHHIRYVGGKFVEDRKITTCRGFTSKDSIWICSLYGSQCR